MKMAMCVRDYAYKSDAKSLFHSFNSASHCDTADPGRIYRESLCSNESEFVVPIEIFTWASALETIVLAILVWQFVSVISRFSTGTISMEPSELHSTIAGDI